MVGSVSALRPAGAFGRYLPVGPAVAAAAAVRYASEPLTGDRSPFLFFLAAVAYSAWRGGLGPGLLAVALGGLAADLLFLPPRGSLGLTAEADLWELALFSAAGSFCALLGGANRRSLASAESQRERLRVTLAGIGDAVAVTDDRGRVDFLNGVAETLTGWTTAEARGRPLEEVFVIVNEDTGAKVENPVDKVLREGVIVGLANHTVLISRDGTRRAIDDSAAPVRSDGSLVGVVLVFRDVTEHRRAERAVRESEERLRLFLDSAPLPMGLVEPAEDGSDVLHVYDNLEAARFFGVAPGATAGKWARQDMGASEETVRLWSQRYAESARTGRPVRFEHRLGGGGREGGDNGEAARWLEAVVVRQGIGPSGRARFCYVCADVTDRKRAEETARSGSERLGLLSEASRLLAASLDYSETLASVARSAVPVLADWCAVDIRDDDGEIRRLGVAHSEPAKVELARELWKRYPPRPEDPRGLMNVLRTGEPELYPDIPDELLVAGARDAEHLRISRELGLRSAMVVPLRAEGRVLGAITLVTAESDRHYGPEDLALARELADRAGAAIENARLHRRVREQADLLDAIMGASADNIYVFDRDGRYLRVSEGAARVLGRSPAEMRGRTWQELGLWPDIMGPVDAHRERVMSTARPETHDVAVEIGGTQRHYEFTLAPIPGAGGVRGVVSVSRDITARKALEAELRRAKEAAEAANRVKDEFLAVLSHELRTPLNAVLGWASMLRTGQLGPQETAHALEVVERNARAQAQLVADLLDVSRIVTGKLQLEVRPTDLSAVVRAAAESLALSASERGVRLEVSAVGAVPVTGDPDRLRQVFANLVGNAVKFTPPGGRVDVRLERAGPLARITVADTGKGIAPELLPRLFERFRQGDDDSTRRRHGGLGLGLALVRHLVKMHRGEVRAESPGEGKGAVFTVELPVSADGADGADEGLPRVRTGDGPAEGIRLDGLRVLLVDDEFDGREMAAATLRTRGAEVRAAGSASEALDALDAWMPDVLVSDIGMPERDGYELIAEVRRRPPDRGGTVPAIALTAFAGAEDRLRAERAGFQAHLPKPLEPDALAAAIVSLAGRARRDDP